MILLRQLARNVPGCVTDLEAGGQPLGLPWRGRLAGRPHRMRARVVPDQDDPPPRGTGRPTPTAASRPRRLSWRFPARCAPCARARRRTLPDWPPHGRRRRSVHRSAKMASRGRFGALVYTVAPLRTTVGMQECTQIGKNGLSGLVWGVRVHCCDAIRQGSDSHKPPKSLITF